MNLRSFCGKVKSEICYVSYVTDSIQMHAHEKSLWEQKCGRRYLLPALGIENPGLKFEESDLRRIKSEPVRENGPFQTLALLPGDFMHDMVGCQLFG